MSNVTATRPSRLTRPRVQTYCSKPLKTPTSDDSGREPGQRYEQPVHLVRGVVVRDAGAERLLRQARPECDAVPVVRVPDAEALVGQAMRRVVGRHAVDVE